MRLGDETFATRMPRHNTAKDVPRSAPSRQVVCRHGSRCTTRASRLMTPEKQDTVGIQGQNARPDLGVA